MDNSQLNHLSKADLQYKEALLNEYEIKFTLEDDQLIILPNQDKKLQRLNDDEQRKGLEWINLTQLNNAEQTQDLVRLLQQLNIETQISESTPIKDVEMGTTIGIHIQSFFIKVQVKDYSNAIRIYKEQLIKDLIIPTDYYLNEFSDQELIDILSQPQDWHLNDILIAQKILSSRSIYYSDDDIFLLQQYHNISFRQPKNINTKELRNTLIISTLGFFIFFIALYPLFRGFYYFFDKSYDLNGKKFHTFAPSTRKFGIYLMLWSIFILTLNIGISIFLKWSIFNLI